MMASLRINFNCTITQKPHCLSIGSAFQSGNHHKTSLLSSYKINNGLSTIKNIYIYIHIYIPIYIPMCVYMCRCRNIQYILYRIILRFLLTHVVILSIRNIQSKNTPMSRAPLYEKQNFFFWNSQPSPACSSEEVIFRRRWVHSRTSVEYYW